jgi:hypothetical protein
MRRTNRFRRSPHRGAGGRGRSRERPSARGKSGVPQSGVRQARAGGRPIRHQAFRRPAAAVPAPLVPLHAWDVGRRVRCVDPELDRRPFPLPAGLHRASAVHRPHRARRLPGCRGCSRHSGRRPDGQRPGVHHPVHDVLHVSARSQPPGAVHAQRAGPGWWRPTAARCLQSEADQQAGARNTPVHLTCRIVRMVRPRAPVAIGLLVPRLERSGVPTRSTLRIAIDSRSGCRVSQTSDKGRSLAGRCRRLPRPKAGLAEPAQFIELSTSGGSRTSGARPRRAAESDAAAQSAPVIRRDRSHGCGSSDQTRMQPVADPPGHSRPANVACPRIRREDSCVWRRFPTEL